MNRRNFLMSAAAGAAVPSASSLAGAQSGGRQGALMKLACHSVPTTPQRLDFFKRHSVGNICGKPTKLSNGRYATVEEMSRLKEMCEKKGVSLDILECPFLASSHIDRTARPAIMLGQSPQRDRDIETVQTVIRNCAKVGIPCMKYNMSLLGVVRTERTPGRGGSTYSTWRLAEAKPKPPLTKAGKVTADIYWERIAYFLERVVPVATENKVRIACHPHDPGMPPEGYQGVDTVLGTPDGLKKFLSMNESPYHGLNFCQGTVSEMLQDPGKEIHDVIRYFGSRKKIFNVHFRNIRGKRDSFQEVYPDEGDIDFFKAIQTYKEVGYPYLLMPDHVPKHPDDPSGSQAFAFAYGYIRALIQAVDASG